MRKQIRVVEIKVTQDFSISGFKVPRDSETRMAPNMQGRVCQLKMDFAAYNEIQNNDGLNEMGAPFSASGMGIQGSHGGSMDIRLLWTLTSQLQTSILSHLIIPGGCWSVSHEVQVPGSRK